MPAKKSETQKSGLEVTIDPDLRYEQAVKELEKLILDMESGKFSLEETLSLSTWRCFVKTLPGSACSS